MRQFFKALVLLPVAILVVLLAVANRAPVLVSLDPFARETPAIGFTLPLFGVIFAAVMLGVIIGGIGAWLAQAKHRKARRECRREVNHLRAETERLRARPAAGLQQSGGLPALPPSGSVRL